MSQSATAIFGARRDQAFPTLAEADIDRMRRFGEAGAYAAGEHIVIAGDVARPLSQGIAQKEQLSLNGSGECDGG